MSHSNFLMEQVINVKKKKKEEKKRRRRRREKNREAQVKL